MFPYGVSQSYLQLLFAIFLLVDLGAVNCKEVDHIPRGKFPPTRGRQPQAFVVDGGREGGEDAHGEDPHVVPVPTVKNT